MYVSSYASREVNTDRTYNPGNSLLMLLSMGHLYSHRGHLCGEHCVLVHCAVRSIVDIRCWTSSLGAVALPLWDAIWGPYVMTNAHECIPQTPTFHTFSRMHEYARCGRRRTPLRGADSQTLTYRPAERTPNPPISAPRSTAYGMYIGCRRSTRQRPDFVHGLTVVLGPRVGGSCCV